MKKNNYFLRKQNIRNINITIEDGYAEVRINKGKDIITCATAIIRPSEIILESLIKPWWLFIEDFSQIFNTVIQECLTEYDTIKRVVLDESIDTNLTLKDLALLGIECQMGVKC